ncbi:glycosyltransferase [Methylacidiphilum caldifontis]|uniref:Glycosyl transferase n=1 Tax=Methylacidiphilum caldifontis TaxID=2795386 RepID=A0A4Y8PG05_9BACT|nr:glycosyltransferase [Methylacidiphilum caldifontis]TFE70820.1 glycosyl transferase [Methylacidiphilum caldifontis]
MTTSPPFESHFCSERIKIHSKFFYHKDKKFFIQGVNYGPFKPRTTEHSFFPLPAEVKKDFLLMQQAGVNTLRLYHFPQAWFLDLAREFNLKVLISIPWINRYDYFSNSKSLQDFKKFIKNKIKENAGHTALLGYFVDNELPPDCIRFYGRKKIEKLLSDLLFLVKETDPLAAVSYANYPPTEYLHPQPLDFYSFNVYLHDPKALENYLLRLQNIAGDKPLLLSEFGMDSLRHGEDEQAWLLEEHIRIVSQSGLAGTIIFSWTDEWFTGGMDIKDWAFGLVQKDRKTKKSYQAVCKLFNNSSLPLYKRFPLKRTPKVSVIVCSYNGAKTLTDCLSSLKRLQYPDYEIIVVDDGSTDQTKEILAQFPEVIALHQPNKGLSAARNLGIEKASGEIVAFTDSDCMADPDWLYFIVKTLLDADYVACGGPNYPPIPKEPIQEVISLAPGSPSHVLLSDTHAEHIPGCNMAFWRWIFEKIGYFDPIFRKAGDDVDICWRILSSGHPIGFNPSAVIWHYRRFTLKEYLRQQIGYGEAEALLRFKHPHYFGSLGGALWKGRIYEQHALSLKKSSLYQGIFGTGLFQFLYPGKESFWSAFVRSFEYIFVASFLCLTLLFFKITRPFFFLPLLPPLLSALSYLSRLCKDKSHYTAFSKFLLFFLIFFQPLVRGYKRNRTWFFSRNLPLSIPTEVRLLDILKSIIQGPTLLSFWSNRGQDRITLLGEISLKLQQTGCKYALDSGWDNWDIYVYSGSLWDSQLLTLTEIYPQNERVIKIKLKCKSTLLNKILLLVLICSSSLLFLAFGRHALWLTLPLFTLLFATLSIQKKITEIKLKELIKQAAKDVGLMPIK